MKPMKQTKNSALMMSAALLVAACGGGGADMAGIDRGGINGGIAIGTVTGFGSVFVNDLRYTTAQAAITIDGEVATTDDLELGYVVRIDAEFSDDGSDPSANAIAYDSDVIGPVDSINVAASALVVLGQSVRTDGLTFFGENISPAGVDGLAEDQLVRVSGFREAGGDILAARIELAAGVGDLLVRGVVETVDNGQMLLTVGGLTIDYSAATQVSGFPTGEPQVGDFVKATGTRDAGSGQLLTEQLFYIDDEIETEEGDDGEIEGLITRFVSSTDFDVAGIPVTTTADTLYEDGNAGDLALNARVEAEGSFNADGVLVADEIEFESEGEARIEASVESVNLAAGTVRVFGIDVDVSSLTSLDNVNPGDCVELSGSEPSPGQFVATKFEREDSCDSSSLRGNVSAVADPQFTLLGFTVLTDGATSFPGGSAAAFFAGAVGQLTEAKGQELAGSLQAEEIEFED